MRIRVLALLATFLLPLPLMADTVTYTYTGNNFNVVTSPFSKTDLLNGSLTLSAPLADNQDLALISDASIDSFSFSDGVNTLTGGSDVTGATAKGYTFEVSTDASGDITGWYIVIDGSGSIQISTSYTGPGTAFDYGSASNGNFGYIEFKNGAWTSNQPSTPSVPEPSTFVLLGTGFLGVAGVVRRKFSAV